jgi:hypothetical protein
MPGLGDLLYLGQPDPLRQITAALNPNPLAQAGPQPPGQGGAAPQPPNAAGAAPAAPPPQTPGQPQPPGSGPPQPMALQSTPDMTSSYAQLARPPDLMGLYMQLAQRQMATDQINRGFAIIAANHSAPGMRNAIMQDAMSGGGNASEMFGNLMNIYQMQQGMQIRQQELASAPDLQARLKANGMDVPLPYIQSEIMAGRGSELLGRLQPTDTIRTYQQARELYKQQNPNATEADIERAVPLSTFLAGVGGGDALTKSYRLEKANFEQNNPPGTPYPWGQDDPMAFQTWKTKQDELTKDQEEAASKRPGYTQNLTDLRSHLVNIFGDPDKPDPDKQAALKHALEATGAQAYLSGDPKTLTTQYVSGLGLSAQDKLILDEIRDTTDPNLLFGTLGKRAPKRGSSDVTEIGASLTSMQNIRKGYDRYVATGKQALDSVDTAIGDAYGAAGNSEGAPDFAKTHIDDAYLPGGTMYPYGKKPTPMSADDIQRDVAHARQNPADIPTLIKIEKASNHDTKELERQLGQIQ